MDNPKVIIELTEYNNLLKAADNSKEMADKLGEHIFDRIRTVVIGNAYGTRADSFDFRKGTWQQFKDEYIKI